MPNADDLKARLLIFILHVTARLPLACLYALGTLIGSWLYLSKPRAYHTTLINLRRCFPEMTEVERLALAKRSLQETSKTALETGRAWLGPVEASYARMTRVEGRQLVDAARAAGKGVIIVAPHLGNWEVLGLYLGREFQTTCLYQPPKYARLDELIRRARCRTGCQVVPTDRKGVAALLRLLKTQAVVGILPDQEPDPSGGVFAPFFGEPALTMTLVPNLLQKTGAVAIACYLKRMPDRTYTLVFQEADPGIYDPDLTVAATGLNRTVEACVRDVPEQYQWEYKRFKARPPGQKRLYPKGV